MFRVGASGPLAPHAERLNTETVTSAIWALFLIMSKEYLDKNSPLPLGKCDLENAGMINPLSTNAHPQPRPNGVRFNDIQSRRNRCISPSWSSAH